MGQELLDPAWTEAPELRGALHELHIQDSELPGGDGATGERWLTIRAADSAGHRSSASILVNRMFAWRNYGSVELPTGDDAMTFVASVGDAAVGTITIGFDSPRGLFVDEFEVNPRHVRFYQRMLGFELVALSRLKQQVNAPAVLLGHDLDDAHSRITQAGQQDIESILGRSLHAYSFSPDEEAGISAPMRSALD